MLLADDHLNIHDISGKQTKLAVNMKQLKIITQKSFF